MSENYSTHYNITEKENAKKSTMGWMKTVLSSGAVGDKMAALTVLVQESPFHGLQHIETLIGMAKKKGKRECIMATGKFYHLKYLGSEGIPKVLDFSRLCFSGVLGLG